MAAHDRLLQVPGEGSGLSQVMSPSAQEQLASVTSALELGNPAYGAIQSTLQVAPGDSRPSEAHLSGYSNGMVNPNVYDPAPSAGPEDVGSSRRAFPDMAAPIGEPHQERDGTAGRPSPTGLQPAAFTMASGAQQQQPTMEESLATSRLATRPSTRTADQTLPGGGPHPVVRWVTRLTEFLRTSTSGGAGGFENVESAGFLQASPTDLAMTPTRLGIRGEDSAMMLGHQTQAMITFSPPEELPQRSGLVVPTSWTQERGPQGEPLFTRDQIRRADELQVQAPLLFPHTVTPVVVPPSSAGSSTHSSLVRAEIQRQLETYDSRQRVEIQRLQQEIFSLRAEREALRQHGDARNALLDGRSGSNAQELTSLASSIGQTVAKAVRPLLPAGLLHSTEPEGSGNLVSRHLASAAPAPVASHQLPGHGGVPQAPPLLPVPKGVSHQLPGHGGVPQAPPLLPVPKGCLSSATWTWWSTTSTSATTSPQGCLSSATWTWWSKHLRYYQSPRMSLISYLDMVEYHKHLRYYQPPMMFLSSYRDMVEYHKHLHYYQSSTASLISYRNMLEYHKHLQYNRA